MYPSRRAAAGPRWLVDRHLAVIARCADVADVVEAVRVAREHRPVLSIRGGGHQMAGSAVCNDGLVIDLSALRGVQGDPGARTAHVQAGATWGEVDPTRSAPRSACGASRHCPTCPRICTARRS